MLNNMKKYAMYMLLSGGVFLASCGDDEAPEPENELEVITNVSLIFTNMADPTDVSTVTAVDPDDDGVQPLQVGNAEITLQSGATYLLTYVISNALNPADIEDIAAEIMEEDDEHQFFYEFTNNAFSDPMGNGNIDNAGDPIRYQDTDDNQLPVGLRTLWTAGDPLTGGSFRTRLQHQPPVNGTAVKTATSGIEAGEPDFNLNFVLNIQ